MVSLIDWSCKVIFGPSILIGCDIVIRVWLLRHKYSYWSIFQQLPICWWCPEESSWTYAGFLCGNWLDRSWCSVSRSSVTWTGLLIFLNSTFCFTVFVPKMCFVTHLIFAQNELITCRLRHPPWTVPLMRYEQFTEVKWFLLIWMLDVINKQPCSGNNLNVAKSLYLFVCTAHRSNPWKESYLLR